MLAKKGSNAVFVLKSVYIGFPLLVFLETFRTGVFDAFECTRVVCSLCKPTHRRPIRPSTEPPCRPAVRRLAPTGPLYVQVWDSTGMFEFWIRQVKFKKLFPGIACNDPTYRDNWASANCSAAEKTKRPLSLQRTARQRSVILLST